MARVKNVDAEKVFGAITYSAFLKRYLNFSKETAMEMAAEKFDFKID